MSTAITATPLDLLREGKNHQAARRLREAAECFAMAVDAAEQIGSDAAVAEGLRRLGIIHHLQGETCTGIHYCERSRDLALASSDAILAAEAIAALANMACEQGRIEAARALYQAALELAPEHLDLTARIEQNLGIVESVQGNLTVALMHYHRALEAHEITHNLLGCARAHHNIGMISADLKEWDAAHCAYDQAAAIARQVGDYHLRGLCLLNHAEIDMAQKRYDEVRRQVEAALAIFDRLGARNDKADAFRMLGTALLHLQRPTLAESHLRSALEIALSAAVPLTEAETCRDMALLYAETDRRPEALEYLDRALVLFEQVSASRDISELKVRKVELLAA